MKKVHVVPHSHWDREWYFTIEDSNAMLVEHLDFLVNYLEQNEDYPYFVFDGQVSIVEEYLRFRPEMETRLKTLITNGRIAIGPWYTQCDSFNPKLESVIRNLQYGIHLGNQYGHVMNVGYLPDAFGQNAYLPAVFKNCNLDFSVLQRGVKTSDAENGLSFKWVAPNGETIDSNYIYFGYGPGKFLETGAEYLADKLMPILNKLENMSNNQDILLPSGGDQALIRTHFKDTVAELNQLQSDYQFELSNYEQFMQSQTFDNQIKGELYTPQKARVHRTIHSQRMDFKILNTTVEKMLIQQLEPLLAIAIKLGITTNNLIVDEMWKAMFDVHAHDSIGGCNSDDTNNRIVARLNEVKAKAEGQINILTKKIAKATLNDGNGLVVFNFSNKSDKVFTAKVFTKAQNFELNHGQVKFTVVDCQYVDGGTKVEVTAEGERQVKVPGYYQTTIEFNLDNFKFGYQTVTINELDGKIDQQLTTLHSKVIKTKDYQITVDNELVIETANDKLKLGFEVETDAGDSYDFAFANERDNQRTTTFKNSKISENEQYYYVDFDTNLILPNNQQLAINTRLTVAKDTDLIKVNHSFINGAKDYRLRTIFITDVTENEHYADSGFGTVTRANVDPAIDSWKQQGYAEMPLAVYPFERFVSSGNLSIINSNVKEYQVTNQGLALTLVRCVGLLGRDDLSTRPGRASGINNVVVETPDAQMVGHNFEIEYHLSLVTTDQYDYYNRVTNNSICYQNQNLNLFENRLERFELPIAITAPTSLEIALPTNLELSSYRYSLNDQIECTMFATSEQTSVVELAAINLVGNEIDKSVLKPKDFITFKETNDI